MTDQFFTGSDSVRSSRPLSYAETFVMDQPLKLELGGQLSPVEVVYETYGRLNERADNAILICHAVSGDSHVAAHNETDDPGWWDILVGPGKCIDTARYFVICPNVLGGCRGSTGPNSINPATGKPFGQNFPTITIADMVDVQRALVDHLGVTQLHAVIGGSMGGHQALCWATRYPQEMKGVAAVATSCRVTSQALAFDVVGRNAILHDQNFNGGQYYDQPAGPAVGLAIARMIGHITYLSRESMREKFEGDRNSPRDINTGFENRFSVGSYLGYKGSKFVERFDANSYVALTMAMDLFDLGGTQQQLATAMAKSCCRWLVLSFTSDWLFPPQDSREIVSALIAEGKQVSYCNIHSRCGHDAFLMENDIDRYGEMIRAFLDNLGDGETARDHSGDDDVYGVSPTSIFQPRRLDYDRIVELIAPADSVLDLGCGGGSLLSRLRDRGQKRTVGVELDEMAILSCVQRGLDVVQADLNEGLKLFADEQFDTVVLSQTLQAVKDVEKVMEDLLRVGRRAVVSFPNFGYRKLRQMLYEHGRAPQSTGLLRFKWYNSPNIRFLTIDDFEDFCRERGIRIDRRITLDTEARREVTDEPNLNADLAIFRVCR